MMGAEEFLYEMTKPAPVHIVRHCLAIIPKAYKLLAEGDLEKCLLVTGFIRGCRMYCEAEYLSESTIKRNMAKIFEYRLQIPTDRIDALHFFLGMMQGMLWSSGMYSLQELETHNNTQPT